ncbi:MAG: VacB/RNase II family 3'-5' exoribonuclease [Planctomycetota bacterium]|nr:VacB/RNase II family 3'-5' exoribonuclease [Planctomycetota bacterium]
MARHKGKSGHRSDRTGGEQGGDRKSKGGERAGKGGDRGFRGGRKGKDEPRGQRRRPSWLAPEIVLEALIAAGEPMSAGGLASNMGVPGEAAREVARVMRELAENGDVVEVRPGRYAVSGAGGEYPVEVVRDADRTGIAALFADERVLPIHPRHTLGVQVGDQAVALVNDSGEALIVRVQTRFGRQIPGSLNFNHGRVTFIPDNRREGEMPMLDSMRDLARNYQAGDRVVVEVAVGDDGEAAARLVRVLDDDSPEVADFELVRLAHDLPGPFDEAVEKAAAEAADTELVPDGRLDLRDSFIFTIDPETAKDFDDAISFERQRGGYRIGVHIADVSHFVRHGSVIDEEALLRGTSCYLVNRVIPMLPETLSNGMCSLVPNEDRYALSVFIELDKHLKVTKVEPAETLICSRHRLNYEEALAIIERRNGDDEFPADLVEIVRHCNRFAQDLRGQRERDGALNLFSVEHSFTLDANGEPLEVHARGSDVAHQLIEEFMLLANRSVAAWLDDRGMPCVYRIHGEPDEERLGFFQGILESYGIPDAPVFERKGLRTVLQRLAKEPPAARLVLNYLCLRSFQKAIYDISNLGHYALAFEHYCHFTSPIRRYPDLIVHRLVKKELGIAAYQDVEDRVPHLDAFARQSSYLERRAEVAERELAKIKGARYLSKRLGETFTGVCMSAAPHGLYIQLMETGLEGLVPVRDLGDEYFEFEAERLALVGRSTGVVYGVGLELDVQVVNVDIPRSEVTLGMAKGSAQKDGSAS